MNELCLGATDNFVKQSLPASQPIISAPIGPRDLKFFVVVSQMMPNKMQYTTWAGLVWSDPGYGHNFNKWPS